MTLPVLKNPKFSLVLPSTGQKIDYQGFTVKEEKLLLMAKEDDSPTGFITAVKQVIGNCIITPNVNVDKFAVFDLELFFLRLRSKSVGSVVEVIVTDEEDKNQYKVQVDLDKIDVIKDPSHKNKIVLDDDSGIGVIMTYPTIDMSVGFGEGEQSEAEAVFRLIRRCIDKVFDNEKVYAMREQTAEEIQAWMDSLSAAHLSKIQQFFDTMPSLKHTITYQRKDGSVGTTVLEGLKDFFQ
jgi:hypothetical protein